MRIYGDQAFSCECTTVGAMSYILFRYLHFIAILVLSGALLIENMAISRTISGEDARNLARVDAVYGISALLVLLFGLTLWLWVGKPAEFYSGNVIFHLKLGIFVLIALLSIYPTLFFLRHKKATAESLPVPALVVWTVRAEIGLLLTLPVLAVLMARGIGLNV
jgi:putative membrane protein